MTKPKRLNRKRELKRIDEQLAIVDRLAKVLLSGDAAYDTPLIHDVVTKLLSDDAVVVMLCR